MAGYRSDNDQQNSQDAICTDENPKNCNEPFDPNTLHLTSPDSSTSPIFGPSSEGDDNSFFVMSDNDVPIEVDPPVSQHRSIANSLIRSCFSMLILRYSHLLMLQHHLKASDTLSQEPI
jgi:hypothetical protein